MKVTYRSDYAIKVLIYLATQPDRTVTIQEIALQQDVPIKFLEQILLQMKRSGYVASKRGASGGYQLNRSASEITVLEILELTEGSVLPIVCAAAEPYHHCREAEHCAMQELFRRVAVSTRDLLGQTTIEGLAARNRALASDIGPTYFI